MIDVARKGAVSDAMAEWLDVVTRASKAPRGSIVSQQRAIFESEETRQARYVGGRSRLSERIRR